MSRKDKDIAKLSFEDSIEELEAIVDQMDGEQVPLDQLIDRYERGADLADRCRDLLGKADARIKEVMLERQKKRKNSKQLEETQDLDKDSADHDDPYDDDIELF